MDVEGFRASQASAEAAAWLSRLKAGSISEADRAAFQRWLAEDPARGPAFEHATAIWDCVGGLADELNAARDKSRATVLKRRKVLAGLGGVAVATGGLLYTRGVSAKVYQTDVGEQKHILLDDGSQLFLDTATRVKADFAANRRLLDLQYGRANFAVQPQGNSFVVQAAGRQIIAGAVGPSVFDIRCDPDQLCIVSIKGQAVVKSADASLRVLNGGDRFVAGRGSAATIDRPDLAPLTAWQNNQAIFKNDRLADAVLEMNRYSTIKLQIDDPTVAAMRISGVYRVGNVAAFAGSVAQVLPVTVYAENGRLLLTPGTHRPREG